MTRGRTLDAAGFADALHRFDHTAFRLELQDQYLEAEEAELYAAFLRGDPPPPTTVPGLSAWYSAITDHVRQGKRVERVRVQQGPPTDYQRFERWMDPWNTEAGEVMRYLTRDLAHRIGLLPAAGNTDWWLHDSARLIVMHFDDEGHRIHNELIDDPEVVLQACKWRDLAVHHATLAPEGAAA